MELKKEKFTIEGETFSCYTTERDNTVYKSTARGGLETMSISASFERPVEQILQIEKMAVKKSSKAKSIEKGLESIDCRFSIVFDEEVIKRTSLIDHTDRYLDDIPLEELISNSDLIENIEIQNQKDGIVNLIPEGIEPKGKFIKQIFGSGALTTPLIKLLDRDYKVYRFNVDKALDALKKSKTEIKKFVKSDVVNNSFNEVDIQIVEKNYWKKECLERLEFLVRLNKRKKHRLSPFDIKGPRALVLFQGLNKRKAGFYDFLAQDGYLNELKRIYGEEIYLLNYPTWFVNVPDKIMALKKAFEVMHLDQTQLDFLCTSTGSVVGKGLAYELSDIADIRSIICSNGPNVGTPIAELTNLGHLIKFASFFFGPVSSPLAALAGALINKMDGVEDLRGTSGTLVELNEKYNSLQRTNDYFVGTQGRMDGNVFDEKPNDGVIPVASMEGKALSDADYGYSGSDIYVSDENVFIIPKTQGAKNHGKQFRNINLTDFIMDKLRGPDPSSPNGELIASTF